MPSTSKNAAKARRALNKKRAKVLDQVEDQEEMEFSESEVSQKRFLKGSNKSTGNKKRSGKKSISRKSQQLKKTFKTITKNYCSDDAPDKQHKYYFRAFIGGGFHVSLAKWLKNKQKYIQIRKATAAANILVSQIKFLKKKIMDI